MDLHEDGCEHHVQQEDMETFDCHKEIKKLVQAILALPPLEEMMMAFPRIKFQPRRNFNLGRHVEEIDSSTLPEVLSLAKRGRLKDLKKLIAKDGAKGALVHSMDGQTVLHFAARGGHTDICEFLIFELHFDVNVKDSMGRTPLHEAALGNHVDALSRLILHGADVNAQASMGLTVLHLAVEAGGMHVISYLISLGCDLDASSDFGTPLWIAAIQNQEEIMQALLTSRANPNIYPDGMLSPLHASILIGSHESVTMLLSAGADANMKLCGASPLEAAIKCGDKTIVELLLNAGAKANVIDDCLTPLEFSVAEKNLEMVRILFSVTSHISTIRDWSLPGVIAHCASEEVIKLIRMKANKVYSLYGLVGQKAYDAGKYHTSLFWRTKEAAARLQEIQNYNDSKLELPLVVEIKMLIEAKMAVLRSSNLNPERLDSSTSKDIFLAAQCGDIEKLRLLIFKFGAKRRKLLSNFKRQHFGTILHIAARNGQTQICKYLIMELKFDINIKDLEGYTPLHVAAIENRTETLSYLIADGADLNAVDLGGKTALHLAAETGGLDAMRLLISRGFDVNAPTDFGTPLCGAILQSSGETMQFLLSHGANPNAYIPEGIYSPLNFAVVRQSYKCIKLLLSAKADPNMKSFGSSPLQFAIKIQDVKAFELLLKGGANPNEKAEYDLTPLELAVLEKKKGMVKKLFPRTAPIPYIKDWSVGGLMKYYRSTEVKKQIRMKALRAYSLYNGKGEIAYKAGRYLTANYWFSRAIRTYQGDRASVYLKKSLCWVHMNDSGIAMEEALACLWIQRKSESVEGVSLSALNEILIEDFERAIWYIESSFKENKASCRSKIQKS